MGMKASEVNAEFVAKISQYRDSKFYAFEFGYVGEDDFQSLFAFDTKRARYLWVASASNVDRWEIDNEEARAWLNA